VVVVLVITSISAITFAAVPELLALVIAKGSAVFVAVPSTLLLALMP
jgi:hypothetical protein